MSIVVNSSFAPDFNQEAAIAPFCVAYIGAVCSHSLGTLDFFHMYDLFSRKNSCQFIVE